MAHEAAALQRSAHVDSERLSAPVIDGDRVVIHWLFTFQLHNGARMTLNELALQTWRGDKIVAETFFYDPKQIGR